MHAEPRTLVRYSSTCSAVLGPSMTYSPSRSSHDCAAAEDGGATLPSFGFLPVPAAALSLAGDRTDARSPDPSSGRDQRGALCVRFTAGEFAPEPVNGALLSPSRETASCLLDEGFMLSSLPLPLFIRLRVREFVGPVSLSSSGTSAATLLFDDPMDGRGDSSALSEGAALSD